MTEKEKYTSAFETVLDEFVAGLQNYLLTNIGECTIKEFICIYKNIYTFSPDTKIVSKILEIHILREILKFTEKAGYKIMLVTHQTGYPDLTLQNRESFR